jgi:hypothetical protein
MLGCIAGATRTDVFYSYSLSRVKLQLESYWPLSVEVFNPLQGLAQTHLLANRPHGPHRCQKTRRRDQRAGRAMLAVNRVVVGKS